MTPQISLAHLARPGASRIIVPFFSATASGIEPPRPAAAAVRTTRSTVPGEPCTPVPTCSPTSRPPDSRPCSPSMSTSTSRPLHHVDLGVEHDQVAQQEFHLTDFPARPGRSRRAHPDIPALGTSRPSKTTSTTGLDSSSTTAAQLFGSPPRTVLCCDVDENPPCRQGVGFHLPLTSLLDRPGLLHPGTSSTEPWARSIQPWPRSQRR